MAWDKEGGGQATWVARAEVHTASCVSLLPCPKHGVDQLLSSLTSPGAPAGSSLVIGPQSDRWMDIGPWIVQILGLRLSVAPLTSHVVTHCQHGSFPRTHPPQKCKAKYHLTCSGLFRQHQGRWGRGRILSVVLGSVWSHQSDINLDGRESVHETVTSY